MRALKLHVGRLNENIILQNDVRVIHQIISSANIIITDNAKAHNKRKVEISQPEVESDILCFAQNDIMPCGIVIFLPLAKVILYSPLTARRAISLDVSRISLRSNITRRRRI